MLFLTFILHFLTLPRRVSKPGWNPDRGASSGPGFEAVAVAPWNPNVPSAHSRARGSMPSRS
jgi:hypothetical protein